jgi:uncharacterized tellurite resistance protein B-like protein
MSHADETYDPSEMATIKKKISELFDENADIERKLYIAIREYNSFDKTKLSQFFRDSFTHFRQDASIQKGTFFDDLIEITQADGKVVHAEKKALQALKEIIELNSAKS